MNINILTIFPEIFEVLNTGIIGQSIKKENVSINCLDIRKNSNNKHNQIDAKPYGGGEGMLMMAEPLAKTIKEIDEDKKGVVINFSPQGKPLTQKLVESFSRNKNITLVCGRYEGIDQRFIDKYVDEEISLGDFVMSGGEIAALSFIDSIIRILPGTLGNPDSVSNDTFSNGMLKGHSYTRPEDFEGIQVPEVLLSGNHSKIKEWKEKNSIIQTYLRRPDLLNNVKLTNNQKKLLEELLTKDIL
jgi:tRNA (guanine37-N1)-methyltransferase